MPQRKKGGKGQQSMHYIFRQDFKFLKVLFYFQSILVKLQNQLWDVNIIDKIKRMELQKGKWVAYGDREEQSRDLAFKSRCRAH